MKRKYAAVIAAAAVLALGGCTKEYTDPAKSEVSGPEGNEKKASDDREAAEDTLFGSFESVTLENEAVDQSIFGQADLTMVNIWATYCQPCISEMPDLGELAKEYEDKGVQIVGIVSDVSQVPNLEAGVIVDYTKADYTHIITSESLLDSYPREVQAVPTTVFVDKDGKQVGDVYTGARSKEAWTEIIESLTE